jgi:glucose-6-phosphate isomerase|tara:strand:- start:5693 stop:6847 length:1155 start_codon:yes stop_codon:yes gene_type:complete
MLTENINFINFKSKKNIKFIKSKLNFILKQNDNVIKSLRSSYKDSYNKQIFKIFRKRSDFRIIGMGGSSLGAQAIYDFLRNKIKKNFYFIDNLKPKNHEILKKSYNNLIISKSGNTIETITNSNVFIKRADKNLFITENKQSYLKKLAKKLQSEVVDHNNYIGGRYSVLSEVGMLPAELMGFDPKKFRQLNNLIKKKSFLNGLMVNVSATLSFLQKKKFNSVIINYDESSTNLFNWYQQLLAESLGKKQKGILPIVSNMPKDNHSVMQLYLDGFKNNFFTFFFVKENNSTKIKSREILSDFAYIKNKNVNQIMYAQKRATEKVFKKKNIPFRSFEIKKKNEKTLGEMFCFFILETILIGKCVNLNPYDQPAVELIKKETKKILT